MKTTIPTIATMFHDGFWEIKPWNNFFTSSDCVVLDTHEYWAFSPTTVAQAELDVCAKPAMTFSVMKIPVFVGEFSLSIQQSTVSLQTYLIEFFATQMDSWLQASGGAFWSFKSYNSDGVTHNAAWSTRGILQSGSFNASTFWNLSKSVC